MIADEKDPLITDRSDPEVLTKQQRHGHVGGTCLALLACASFFAGHRSAVSKNAASMVVGMSAHPAKSYRCVARPDNRKAILDACGDAETSVCLVTCLATCPQYTDPCYETCGADSNCRYWTGKAYKLFTVIDPDAEEECEHTNDDHRRA